MSDIIKMKKEGAGRVRTATEKQRKSILHTVITKDLGQVIKKQGMMAMIQHTLHEIKK